jgi:HTH-type transcriptional regulator, global nitrogen regulator NrpRI
LRNRRVFMEKTLFTILTLLGNQNAPLTSREVTRYLKARGIDLSERMIRHYLHLLEIKGFVFGEKKKGRRLTERGRQELAEGFVAERVGFAINRINNLSFLSDFNVDSLRGRVILNIATLAEDKLGAAFRILDRVLNSPYAMSSRILVAQSGQAMGDFTVPDGLIGIGTMCSVTINGIFLKAGIPVCSKFGGIVEIVDGVPERFSSIISYEGSSVAPLEVFMKGGMTNVLAVLDSGNGSILGSFREIPEASLSEARKLNEKMRERGLPGIVLFGPPAERMLDIAVTPGKAGVVVLGGLNPMAALQEAGIPAETKAMATLVEYEHLRPFEELKEYLDNRNPGRPVAPNYTASGSRRGDYWSIFSEMQQMTL